MVLARVFALLSAMCPKLSLFLLVVIWVASRMLGMLIPNASVLLSAICPKFLLVFANSV